MSALLPEGAIKADIMHVVFPPRLEALTARVQKAAQKYPKWWVEHIRKAKPGEPLDYHPNLGLTKAEYQEFLKLSEDGPAVVKRGSGVLTVGRGVDGLLRLEGTGEMASLSGVQVDPETEKLVTPFGTCDSAERREAAHMRTLGSWDGFYWELEKDKDFWTSGDGLRVRFHLGRLRKSGRGVIYYRATRTTGGRTDARIRLTITYPLPR